MPLVLSSSLVVSPLMDLQFKLHYPRHKSRDYCFGLRNVCSSISFGAKTIRYSGRNFLPCGSRLIARVENNGSSLDIGEGTLDLGWEDLGQEGVEDDESPWEGAIVYKRNGAISHVEYCTTLERLGLGKLSTSTSKAHASVMGLRVTKAVKDYPDGTPVLVSIDVTRKKQKLRLDGVLRTVLTLGCNRCGEPAAQCVFSNFSLLLNEEPIAEEDTINMGTIFGEEKYRNFRINEPGEEDDDDASIDPEDRLFFPPEEKLIDISKNIRDLVHIEITLNALCDPLCKGLCLRCGVNLNLSSCVCETQKVDKKFYGPLGGLKEQMQQN